MDGQLAAEGQPIDPGDSMVAGIALAHGMDVATGNPDHVQPVDGLGTRTYEKG